MKRIVYIVLAFAFGFVLLGDVRAQDVPQSFVITLTNDGFIPTALTVPIGAEVTFRTTEKRYFWPASNEHPAHTAYSEFDPKRPVAPDEQWVFRFEKTGTWGFHDHISPFYIGTITVTGDGVAAVPKKEDVIRSKLKSLYAYVNNLFIHNLISFNYRECTNSELGRSERIQCWERIVETIVQKKGLHVALQFVSRMKSKNTAFAADCHVYVHRVGEQYYWRFINNRKIEVSDNFDLCDQGFFHGFMQEFTSHGQNITEAKRYCDALIAQISDTEKGEKLRLQCYHGIGHGLTFLYAPMYWEQNDEIMRRGTADCRTMFPQSPRFCISGVYGGMAAMFWGLHGFTLPFDPENPFGICANQKPPDSTDCYDQFVPVVHGELGLEKTGKILERLPDAKLAAFLMEHLGSMPSYTIVPTTNDYTSILLTCRSFRPDLATRCLHGFAAALARIGSRAEGEARGDAFCRSGSLTPDERITCYDGVVQQLADRYSVTDVARFCQRISREYQGGACPASGK